MLPVDFIALMLVLETVDFFIVKKQLEMHIIVLEGQYIADNFEMASCLPSPDAAKNPSAQHPNWWTDNPASEFAEGDHIVRLQERQTPSHTRLLFNFSQGSVL